ncbi:hypothetical protein D3C78_1765470 [compost metagenome]
MGVQHCSPRTAIEQSHPQIFLQALDLGADRRLRQAQMRAGSGEGAIPRHRDECLEFFDHDQFF